MGNFEIAPWLHYECIRCGLCCRRGFSIWCPLPDRIRLGDIPWGERHPELAGKQLFIPLRENYRIALDKSGACVFLDGEGRCIQHTELGFDAKTLACKMYPMTLAHSFGRVHVGLLFSCPAVVDRRGPSLQQQEADLKKLQKEMDSLFPPPPFNDETAFDATRSITFRNLRFLEESVIEALGDESLPLTRRILFAGNILDLMDNASDDQLSASAFHESLIHYREKARESAANCGLKRASLGLFERFFLRQLLGMASSLTEAGLLSSSFSARIRARLRRIFVALRHMSGRGDIPLQETDWRRITGSGTVSRRRVTFRDVEAVSAYHLPAESEDAISRYLRTRIAARTYFGSEGWGLSVLPGMRTILTLASLVIWFAKAHAASSGREAVTHEDIRSGIILVEHAFGHMSSVDTGMAARPLAIATRAGWPQKVLLATMLS